MSGETWTASPLAGEAMPAIAVQKITYVKEEQYSWQDGAKIYEEIRVRENGEWVTKQRDSGRREPGHWIAREVEKEAGRETAVAPSGLCMRQLGATDGVLHTPKQVC